MPPNISLRDYFAGQALVGLFFSLNQQRDLKTAVEDAYKIADEMVKASKKKD